MKYIITILFFLWGTGMLHAAELQKVEELTQIEKMELKIATERAVKANKELERVKDKIAASHNMNKEDHMEWSSYYEISGSYILYFQKSHVYSGYKEYEQ